MDLRQLLNRPEKPKPKLQLLLAKSKDDTKVGYCIVLRNYRDSNNLLHSTDNIDKSGNVLYQCYSPGWAAHKGFDDEINHTFCRLYNTLKDGFWNIRGNRLTAVPPEEFPYKKFLEYKNIKEEIIRIQAEIGVEHNLGRLEGID